MAPTMQKGSFPSVTAGGSGASAGSWDRSSSPAKKRMNGPAAAGRPVPDGPAEDGEAGLEGAEHRLGRDRIGHVELHFPVDAGQRLEVGGEHDPDHGRVCTSTDSTGGRSRDDRQPPVAGVGDT